MNMIFNSQLSILKEMESSRQTLSTSSDFNTHDLYRIASKNQQFLSFRMFRDFISSLNLDVSKQDSFLLFKSQDMSLKTMRYSDFETLFLPLHRPSRSQILQRTSSNQEATLYSCFSAHTIELITACVSAQLKAVQQLESLRQSIHSQTPDFKQLFRELSSTHSIVTEYHLSQFLSSPLSEEELTGMFMLYGGKKGSFELIDLISQLSPRT